MKPCTRRVSKTGKKALELYVQNFDNHVKAVVGVHMKEYRNKAAENKLGLSRAFAHTFLLFVQLLYI